MQIGFYNYVWDKGQSFLPLAKFRSKFLMIPLLFSLYLFLCICIQFIIKSYWFSKTLTGSDVPPVAQIV